MPHLNKTAWGQIVSSAGGKKYAQGRRGEERGRKEGGNAQNIQMLRGRCLLVVSQIPRPVSHESFKEPDSEQCQSALPPYKCQCVTLAREIYFGGFRTFPGKSARARSHVTAFPRNFPRSF